MFVVQIRESLSHRFDRGSRLSQDRIVLAPPQIRDLAIANLNDYIDPKRIVIDAAPAMETEADIGPAGDGIYVAERDALVLGRGPGQEEQSLAHRVDELLVGRPRIRAPGLRWAQEQQCH